MTMKFKKLTSELLGLYTDIVKECPLEEIAISGKKRY